MQQEPVPDADAQEQHEDREGPLEAREPSVAPEAPEPDAIEQQQAVGAESTRAPGAHPPDDAPEADVLEQAASVGDDDEDEWR